MSFGYTRKSEIVGLHENYKALMEETEDTHKWKHTCEISCIYGLGELILLKFM